MDTITHAARRTLSTYEVGAAHARAAQFEKDMAKRNLRVTVTVAHADVRIVDNEEAGNHGR